MSAVVRVQPIGVDIDLRPGETLIEAAWREGYDWPTSCYGQAQCMVCRVRIIEGAENVSAMGTEETNALRINGLGGEKGTRLACLLEVHGPATVEKDGVQRCDA
jgi:2Fe-2S ferredoxin